MESKIKSYEEQVLELGNGKMLKPGCYNEKMKKLCDISDIKTLGIKNPGHRYYDDIDNIYYVVCPKSMNYFGSGLFSNMVNLRAVVLPDDLKEISLYCFSNCGSLSEITLPSGITKICDYAFMYSGLTSIYIPDSVAKIDTSAFTDCDNLVSFSMPAAKNSVDFGPHVLDGCVNLENAVLPEGLKKISYDMFRFCKSLAEIKIPSTVSAIESHAFYMCNYLQFVRILSDSVKFENNAFDFYDGDGIVEYKGKSIPMSYLRPMDLQGRVNMMVKLV